ncbi:MAG: biotin--protein ligase [Candidatus Diapherotrites archaeon]|nr:biotin--protein ligase [Candidatus Diapherotrites archaeon]
MQGKSVFKVPQGKLLKVFLDFEPAANRIISVKITGDFFLHPENGIELVEKNLKGKSIEEAESVIALAVKENDLQFFGADPASIALAIKMASENAKGGE